MHLVLTAFPLSRASGEFLDLKGDVKEDVSAERGEGPRQIMVVYKEWVWYGSTEGRW